MNKMYEYLKNHAYISYNKKSNYEFELSKERAECIANKYDSLTDELQRENKILKENKQLKERIEYLERSNNRREGAITEQYHEIVGLETRWNKLKEYIGAEWYCYDNDSVECEVAGDILDKMQELQGSDSNVKK